MWKPDQLLKAILIWTTITLIKVWLPLVRGLMDGDSYQWETLPGDPSSAGADYTEITGLGLFPWSRTQRHEVVTVESD